MSTIFFIASHLSEIRQRFPAGANVARTANTMAFALMPHQFVNSLTNATFKLTPAYQLFYLIKDFFKKIINNKLDR